MPRLNGCHNRPRPVAGAVTHIGQVGWNDKVRDLNGAPMRIPVYTDIKHVMSTECRYDASAKDPGCAGCKHARA